MVWGAAHLLMCSRRLSLGGIERVCHMDKRLSPSPKLCKQLFTAALQCLWQGSRVYRLFMSVFTVNVAGRYRKAIGQAYLTIQQPRTWSNER
eukprot:scaffold21986_cov30-Tisochrysis_lutea.AAC.5